MTPGRAKRRPRYKVLTGEFADLMLGYYGYTIGEKDPEVIALAKTQTGKEIITGRPADLIDPEWAALRTQAEAIDGSDGSDEDVLTYARDHPGVRRDHPARREAVVCVLGHDRPEDHCGVA
jgi:methylmalonyl-CoA carboxyltransferase 5S subunit